MNKCIGLLFCLMAGSIESQSPQVLIDHVIKSIVCAYQEESKLTQDILLIEGMSSSKVRHLLNNLCRLPGSSYLEIGVFKGSTFISALYGNEATIDAAIAIDNWSEFGQQRSIFTKNTSVYLSPNSFTFYEQDAFSSVNSIVKTPINIYFYDGNHSSESQCRAFTHFNDFFADTFIAVIDDWNWKQVQQGTKKAFKELKYTILFEEELPSYTPSDNTNWWNGVYIAVIKKTK